MYFCSFVNFTFDPDLTTSTGLVVVFFDDVSAEHQAESVMSRTVRLLILNKLIQKPYAISASIGSVITVAQKDDTLFSVIKMADDKMYEVKKEKKAARKSEKV